MDLITHNYTSNKGCKAKQREVGKEKISSSLIEGLQWKKRCVCVRALVCKRGLTNEFPVRFLKELLSLLSSLIIGCNYQCIVIKSLLSLCLLFKAQLLFNFLFFCADVSFSEAPLVEHGAFRPMVSGDSQGVYLPKQWQIKCIVNPFVRQMWKSFQNLKLNEFKNLYLLCCALSLLERIHTL